MPDLELEGERDGNPSTGEGAGEGGAGPKISRGSKTWSISKMAQGTVL